MDTKMVIIIRKDLKMRRGKEIAQACHGAIAAITNQMWDELKLYGIETRIQLDQATIDWMQNSYRKITVTVNSEQKLMDIYKRAENLHVRRTLIEDNGLTEFHNVKTKTVLVLGPDYDDRLDEITKHLTLY